MAHNQDARSNDLCAAARDGFNEVVTQCQLAQDGKLASLAKDLGAGILAGLKGTEGRTEAHQMEKTPELAAKGEGRGA